MEGELEPCRPIVVPYPVLCPTLEDEHPMEPVTTSALPYLLTVPTACRHRHCPLLVFLHDYDEAAPAPTATALTRHGPLHPQSAGALGDRFIVAAPQLPFGGDIWHSYGRAVSAIVSEVQAVHGGDPVRTYLTGFSFGGNGVFDLALADPARWAALWAVDPTRVPRADPGLPVWLSFGEVSRRSRSGFLQALKLHAPSGNGAGDRVGIDEGEDHVGAARRAYRDRRIYDWLLEWHAAAEGGEG